MNLLDKPLTQEEISSTVDLIKGNIARICSSDDAEEIVRSLGFAIDRLSMIAYSKIKEKGEKYNEKNN